MTNQTVIMRGDHGQFLSAISGLLLLALGGPVFGQPAASVRPADVRRSIDRALVYLANSQARDGRWEADGGTYRVAMTALAGTAFLLDGNTPLQGRYSKQVRLALGFILDQAQPSGLIGYPDRDARYMYGHGFSMLFLSQVLGEEEDARRRERIVAVLKKAVVFTGGAQTVDGGWGYLTARDGQGFDEGSVTITQMQALRSCRDAGIVVPKEIIDKGLAYIDRCTDNDGGVRYSLKTTGGGGRPPITAAAVACMFSAGEYGNPLAKKLLDYSERTLMQSDDGAYGHWHYAHYYYSQVVYRLAGKRWDDYKDKIFKKILLEQDADGSWKQGYVGPVYTTALNITIMMLDNDSLPVYQR